MNTKNPFKVGDKVICIKTPQRNHYQCAIGVKATIKEIDNSIIYVEENICTSTSSKRAC